MKLSNLMAVLALLVVSPAHAQVCPYENLMPEFTEFVAATADLGPQARAEASDTVPFETYRKQYLSIERLGV